MNSDKGAKKRSLKESKGECFVSICGITTEAGGNGMGTVEFWPGTGYDFTLQCRQGLLYNYIYLH